MALRSLIISAILILLGSASATAQDLQTSPPSTELKQVAASCPPAPTKDPSQWARSLSFGFSMTSGNSDTTNFNGRVNFARDLEDNIWDFGADYAYGDSNENEDNSRQTTENELLGHASYRRLISERWFVGLGGAYKRDTVAEIDYRVFLNPTLGSYLIRNNVFKLSVEIGPSYVIEKVDRIEDDYLAPRIGNQLTWTISPNANIFQKAEFLGSIDDSDNYIINAEIGAESLLTNLLSLVFVVRNAYDHQPAENKEMNDIAIITSLKVNL